MTYDRAIRRAMDRIATEAAGLFLRHAISETDTVRDALEALNRLSGEAMTLFVIEKSGRLAGTLTDGDVRRGLLAGFGLDSDVAQAAHHDFMAARSGDEMPSVMRAAREKGIDLLPVAEDGFVTDIIDLRRTRTKLPIQAVLMAGGRGERLRPLTIDTPKPLLKVGEKAIIDYNVDELEACGVGRIIVTVNYLADQIVDHFAGRKGKTRVECIREPKRLGTMGSLSLAEGIDTRDVLVMNSDLLTNLDFEAMYLHHIGNGADLTVAAVPYTVSVPFAIMNIEGDVVKGLREKPTYNYFANAGVYMMRTELLRRIPADTYVDAPDFISSLIGEGGKVGYFPIEGTWIDIGSPDDFRYANGLMSTPRR